MLRQALVAPSRALSSSFRLATRQAAQRPQFYNLSARATPAIRASYPRWYSAEAEAKESASKEASEDGAKPKDTSEAQEANDAIAELKKQLEAKEAEAKDLKDKYLRSVAEFRTLQDKTARDMKAAKAFAIEKFAKDLVPSVDNLDRALLTVPKELLEAEEKTEHLQHLVNLFDGLKMTEKILMSTLEKHGLERFDPVGERYNPNEHEAEFMAPMPALEDGNVFHTNQKGFKLNGRVLRAAKVGVVKNK